MRRNPNPLDAGRWLNLWARHKAHIVNPLQRLGRVGQGPQLHEGRPLAGVGRGVLLRWHRPWGRGETAADDDDGGDDNNNRYLRHLYYLD
jgi:hypothetical protein